MTEPEVEVEETRTVADLQDELREKGLPVSGTKAELVERLEHADDATDGEAAAEPEAPDETPDLATVAEDTAVNLVSIITHLDGVKDKLTAAEAAVTDPAAAAVMDASGRVRAHLDDALRHMNALLAACQTLASEASALATAGE